jgi:hypothetical protein
VALHTIRCADCREPFEASRSDATTCSAACRKRRHRAASAALQAREIEHAAALLASLRAAARSTPRRTDLRP